MKKITLVVLLGALFLSGCVGTSKTAIYGISDSDKYAELKYTKIGLTSDFELPGLATGTYKSIGKEAGLFYYAGSQNIELTVNGAQNWKITTESKRQSFKLPNIGVQLHNPYVGEIRYNDKTIGNIGISMPDIDKTKEALKYVGMDNLVHTNLQLSGEANILGKRYEIASVFKDANGEQHNSPIGYTVSQKGKTLGTVQVGHNMMGGQELQLWITQGLKPLDEQSVISTLLVCGYAI